MEMENTEKIINKFLQKEVVFFITPEKPLKTGKFLIFKFKDFYFNFIIKCDTGSKILEIPYPFKIDEGDNFIKFSYTLEDFSQKNIDLLIKAKLLSPKKRNKLYNSTVVLSALN
jgi:hypothetical protein